MIGIAYATVDFDNFFISRHLEPAVISGIRADNTTCTLGVTNLTVNATHAIMRTDSLFPTQWTTAGAFRAVSTSTNWADTVTPSKAFYRIDSKD